MHDILQFLVRHGYAVLFVAVFLEQTGFPVPAVPVLLGVGALSAEGVFSPGVALVLALLASIPADMVWYQLGRRRGFGVLRVLCRLSLEADNCVRGASGAFRRHGSGTLVVAKFIPGLSTVAPPLAGMLRMSTARFLLLDGMGAALWASVYLGLGFVFRTELERIAAIVANTGVSMAVVIVCALAAYIGWKWLDRRRYLRQLDMARLAPEELWRRMQAGEEITIIDLRHAPAIGEGGASIPGAMHFPAEDLETRHQEIPRDREIVLYCS